MFVYHNECSDYEGSQDTQLLPQLKLWSLSCEHFSQPRGLQQRAAVTLLLQKIFPINITIWIMQSFATHLRHNLSSYIS